MYDNCEQKCEQVFYTVLEPEKKTKTSLIQIFLIVFVR